MNRRFGQQITNGIRAVHVQHAYISEPRRFETCFPYAPGQAFNAEKIRVWMALCQLAQERTVPAAKIDTQGRAAPKDCRKIERRDVGADAELSFRDQRDHGNKLRPLRDDATSQRLKLNGVKPRRFVLV